MDMILPQEEKKEEKEPTLLESLFCCFKGGNDDFAENYELEMRRSFVYGHPDQINMTPPVFSKSEIKANSQKEVHHVIVRNVKKKHSRNPSSFDDTYQLIELAPQLFNKIRSDL